ncbi:MAG TPA: 6-phosphogluconolactonase [Gammaproteobacteria bacterium]|nr:6-phosphogluconolactonase [Gammaproteobacteria bacterium]
MKLEVFRDADGACERGAEILADQIHAAMRERGRALVALSGGRTPWAMLEKLAAKELPWDRILFFQVDERDCPAEDDARNLKHLHACLPVEAQIEAMPVESGEAGAGRYASRLASSAGNPPVLDVVHLGLGPDGHTASLVPGDAVLEVRDREVAWTLSAYQGRRRMTVTYPLLDRARFVFWLVAGEDKREALAKLLDGDSSIPAGRVRNAHSLVLAEATAAGEMSSDR